MQRIIATWNPGHMPIDIHDHDVTEAVYVHMREMFWIKERR